MTLAEYRKSHDNNKFWRLKIGVVENLLDEAIDRIEKLENLINEALDSEGTTTIHMILDRNFE